MLSIICTSFVCFMINYIMLYVVLKNVCAFYRPQTCVNVHTHVKILACIFKSCRNHACSFLFLLCSLHKM